ncbi:PEP-CTERM sorting domain-containing protein [Acidiphilium sp. PA]|uniref:PEP-CTERM sorting domain-containing protein n=1 Tax=Acidiphilium sp. PA TaxID=2871705 RepID=UPI002243DFB0|nr:PEP-CTERM sorting domain-containing protein [Acidiphilium sp. PA]MCW8305430.1 PEP-CTERM sorting domain-containing protein [Acidiphilium sp. PA]
MKTPFVPLLLITALSLPVAASASVVIRFYPTVPSTNTTATISYSGSYITPSPATAPFAASPFSFTATLPAQSYAPDGIGTGLAFSGVSGTYTNNGVTTDYSNATLELLGQYIQTFSNGRVVQQTEQTQFFLTIGSLLQSGDHYALSMIANQFLYTESDPLVANPLTAPPRPCSYCTPAIVTMLPGPFSVLSGGIASYTPPSLPDPQANVNAGGSGSIASPLVAVPEPGSLILLGGGVLMFALINWWLRRRAARSLILRLR